ncbi:MAG: diphosphate--fructose-6-phosphate 1-phosphotransferase [Fibrobacteria bacterium]|nr:diphosphate--fructose-6-phosphate 1-phosphotransferase [Fibrobacteria bacterium]
MQGNALIGQSGGPTAVINSTLCGLVQQAEKSKNIQNIYGMRYGIEGFMKDEVSDLGSESPSVIQGLRSTPSSALGSCRYKVQDKDFPLILDQLKKYNIRYFFLIGGNDTMDTIHRVEKYCQDNNYELCGIGLPKTVDNDLYGTDHTPGYPSAARYVALSTQQSSRLAADMQRVDRYVIHQTVGRESGFLAAAAGLAKQHDSDGPHLIYMPERKLNKETFIKDATSIIEANGWVSIICGEGILWEDGTPVSASNTADKFSNIEFGAMGGSSAAMNLHKILSDETGYRGEFQITESLSMCGIDRASKIDLEEAYGCGVKAMELADNNETGIMVTLVRPTEGPYKTNYGTAPLMDVAVKAKPMPDEFINEAGNFVTPAFIDYLKPLVGDLGTFSVLQHQAAKAQ